MTTFLIALLGGIVGAIVCMLALTYIIKKQLDVAYDINDAPCLCCDRQQCECGE